MSSGDMLDVLVVGGGVTGAGIALDAATRGLKVGIVEAQDWSSGTSSRSSKLVHGGLRYLYQLNFALVAESLRERGLLLTQNAPHLVKAQPLLWPLKIPVIERTYSAVGVGMYDAIAQIAHRGSVPTQRHHTKKTSLKLSPALKPDALNGSIVYYDARVDDSRLVITLVRTAVRYGALAANRVQLVGIEKDATGHVCGAELEDLESGKRFHVKTRSIINATGVWTEKTQSLGGSTGGLKVLASKGIHLVVPKNRIKSKVGLFLRTEKSVLFIIPWKRYWIIGTTDTKYHEDLRNPVADKEDIQYLLDHANSVLRDPLTTDDILGTFAGLRPLLQPGTLDGDEAKSTKVSREHTVTEAVPGLTVIAGGKLTSYRQMAEDAVDFTLGERRAKERPCVTAETPLQGADGYHALWNSREKIAAQSGLTVDQVEDLLDRYGSDIFAVLDSIKERPDLAQPLQGAPEYLRADVAFGVSHEGALHLEDILLHRVRLVYEHRDAGLSAVSEIADLMAEILKWNKKTKDKEIKQYEDVVRAVREAATIEDESEAQAVREAVEPIRPFLNV
ncbi:glycerol-3-phosphate dehydrogenase/oxidase [Actinomycetaceae bacterium WB03_NA08]|uniref:Glycerol-3-phosphate dehydrogenase n=2 Tax=Scrofimicrobium canadense TaxID=2652290 RepID=A0A6N7W4D9_9ACTO|nr:glycerol-3-phosphate dehydrogenase/oxidase [Scrofimicrobium canadense]MSS83383.1 glycerol-3-phosphate dehydrogenase/oxidase [Scrofimicrobium canadense]